MQQQTFAIDAKLRLPPTAAKLRRVDRTETSREELRR